MSAAGAQIIKDRQMARTGPGSSPMPPGREDVEEWEGGSEVREEKAEVLPHMKNYLQHGKDFKYQALTDSF